MIATDLTVIKHFSDVPCAPTRIDLYKNIYVLYDNYYDVMTLVRSKNLKPIVFFFLKKINKYTMLHDLGSKFKLFKHLYLI